MFEKLEQIKKHPAVGEWKEKHPAANVIVVVFAVITLWRGIWELLDEIWFPNSPIFSSLSCVVIGGLVLYLDGFSLKDLKR